MRHTRNRLICLSLALFAWLIIPLSHSFPAGRMSPFSWLFPVLSFLLSLFVLSSFVVGVFRFFQQSSHSHQDSSRPWRLLRSLFDSPVRVPGKAFFAYTDLLETVAAKDIDFLINVRELVRSGQMKPDDDNFNAFLSEMKDRDFRSLIRTYRLEKSRQFFISLLLSGASLIFTFSALYLLVHVVTSGKGFVLCPAGSTSDSWLESLYFSVSTAGTVGYGDIHPAGSSPWAESMAIIEITLAFFFVAYFVNFGLSLVHSFDITAEELGEALRSELEGIYDAASIINNRSLVGVRRG